jgi:hypothetical protein
VNVAEHLSLNRGMHRTAIALAFILAACSKDGSSKKTPSNTTATPAVAAAAGYGDVESALKAFNAALESGDRAAIRAQFPSRASYESHVAAACADAWDKMFDEWAQELVNNNDIKAMKGRHSELVKVDNAETRPVEAGAEGEGCKFNQPFAFVKTSSTWKLEGENHQFGVTLVQLEGRYFAFDLPGK